MIITGCGGELDGSSLYRLRNNQGAPVIIPDGTKIGLIAENSDDIWTLYNLIEPKDFVETTTVSTKKNAINEGRKVLNENSTGDVVDSRKIKMRLAVCVEKVDVDLAVSTGRTDLPHSSVAPIDGGFLRVNGKNQTENRHVKIGSYHTLEIIPERPLYLTKIHWDALAVQILRQAAGSIGRVEVGAIAMDPIKGVACVCLITPTGIDNPLSRINIPMPKKRIGSTSQTEKVDAKFLDACLDASLKYIRFDQLKAIVIGSSVAQSRDLFCEKLLSRISSSSSVHIKTQKTSDIARKFVRVTITDGTPAALQTVLSDSRVSSILSDTKVAREQAALDDYHKTCNMDQFRVTFGPRHVEAAASEGAVRHLLLTDACFRSSDVKERKFYSKIVCDTEENGGQVIIFSQDSKPSKDLAAISGIAAILNWPIKPDDEK